MISDKRFHKHPLYLSSVQKITSRFIEVLTLADTLKMNRLAR